MHELLSNAALALPVLFTGIGIAAGLYGLRDVHRMADNQRAQPLADEDNAMYCQILVYATLGTFIFGCLALVGPLGFGGPAWLVNVFKQAYGFKPFLHSGWMQCFALVPYVGLMAALLWGSHAYGRRLHLASQAR